MTANFTMIAGDDKVIGVTIVDEAGAPLDLTGATIRWRMGRRLGGTASVTKTTDDGIEIIDAAAGEREVTLEATDTESLSGDFMHEMEVTDANGLIGTVLQGRVAIARALIRAT